MVRRIRRGLVVPVLLWAVACVVTAGLLVFVLWALWRVPQALYAYLPAKDRASAEATTRTGMIAGLAGLAALGSLAVTTRTYRLTQQGQLTDRYTKATAQLGDDKLEVRIGGIYALERIAVDSKRDQATIVEVLSAYVRDRAFAPQPVRPVYPRTAHPRFLQARAKPGTDVQAALTVLGRLPRRAGVLRGDLREANLAEARLEGADLTEARLDGANLTGAWLYGANLTGAILEGANLTGARLVGANLTNARLYKANLTGADFLGAALTVAVIRAGRTKFTGANLVGAKMRQAWLLDADFSDVDLAGADLTGAHLWGADLTKAIDLTQDQVDVAEGNEQTALPDELMRPGHWGRTDD